MTLFNPFSLKKMYRWNGRFDSWKGWFGVVGFAWHPRSQGGVYRSGKHWIVWSCIDKYGITFPYKGEEVIWVWPWKRSKWSETKWLNVSLSYTEFNSLKDIDKFWKEYSDAQIAAMENQVDPSEVRVSLNE